MNLIAKLGKDILAVDKECVVFNWECCSDCNDTQFGGISSVVMDFTTFAIEKGWMSMFSDFSLKALVGNWKGSQNDKLGTNPFKKIGEIHSEMTLHFDPFTLEDCPSDQLQKVGKLCENGQAKVHAMSGTIAQSVDKTKIDHSK